MRVLVLLSLACACSTEIPSPSPASRFPTPTRQRYLGREQPQEVPLKFAPGLVTQQIMNHSVPTFAPDGTEVFWARTVREPKVVMHMM